MVTEIPSGTGGSVTVGLSTCYDLRFPELYRQQVEAGAELFVVPAAWPAARVGHWTLLGRARADREPVRRRAVQHRRHARGLRDGRAQPGRHARAARCSPRPTRWTEQEVLSVEVDLAATRDYRAAFPVLDDRRL